MFGEQIVKGGIGTRTILKIVKWIKIISFYISTWYNGNWNRLWSLINPYFTSDYSLHFILSTSYEFFLDELLAILKLREKNDGIKLAMVIIYAKVLRDDEVESIR